MKFCNFARKTIAQELKKANYSRARGSMTNHLPVAARPPFEKVCIITLVVVIIKKPHNKNNIGLKEIVIESQLNHIYR